MGARFGFDFVYEVGDATFRTDGHAYDAEGGVPDYSPDAGLVEDWFVPFNSDWTYRETYFTVPTGVWGACTTQITSIGVWFQVSTGWMNPEMGDVWFSDTWLTVDGELVYGDSEFYDDFETGDLSLWDAESEGNGAVDVSSSGVYSGVYSLNSSCNAVVGTSAYVYKGITATDFMYYSSYVKFLTALPADGEQFLFLYFCNDTGDGVASARLYSNSTDTVWRVGYLDDDSEVGADNTSLAVSLGVWYHVEFVVSVSGTVGYASLWIDGVLVQNATGLDNNNRGSVVQVNCGETYSTGGVAHQVMYDEVVVSDSYVGVPVYTVDLTVLSPTATTYTDDVVEVSVTNAGNDTGVFLFWNMFVDDVAVYEEYQDYNGVFNYSFVVSGDYNFTVFGVGDHGGSDVVNVTFVVSLPVPTATPAVTTPDDDGVMFTGVLLFLVVLNVVMVLVGGWLLPLGTGLVSITVGALALQESASIWFSPYLQLLLVMVASFCIFYAAARSRGWVR